MKSSLFAGIRAALSASRAPDLFLLLFLVVESFWIFSHFEPAVTTKDSPGYCVPARILVETGSLLLQQQSPLEEISFHWITLSDGESERDRVPATSVMESQNRGLQREALPRFIGKYPPGLPLILAFFYALFGANAALAVMPSLAVLTLLGFALSTRRLFGPWWSFLPLITCSVNPIFNERALTADSHMSVSFLIVWGVYCLLRSGNTQSKGWAFISGVCFGFVPLIRYAEIVLIIAPVAYLIVLIFLQGIRRLWKDVTVFFIGAMIPMLLFFGIHLLIVGTIPGAGYRETGEIAALTLDNLAENYGIYTDLIVHYGVGWIAWIGLLGMCAMLFVRQERAMGLLHLGLVIPLTFVYMCYYWMPQGKEWLTMRFLLPTIFWYFTGITWIIARTARYVPRFLTTLAVILFVGYSFLWGGQRSLTKVRGLDESAHSLRMIARFVDENTPEGSPLILPRSVTGHFQYFGRYRIVRPDVPSILARDGVPKREVPSFNGPEARQKIVDQMFECCRGLHGAALRRKITDELRFWSGTDGPLFWLMEKQSFRDVKKLRLQGISVSRIAHLPPLATSITEKSDRFNPPDGPLFLMQISFPEHAIPPVQ